MTNSSFSPHGVTLQLSSGPMVLNAGANMTIFPSGNLVTFAAKIPPNVSSLNGAIGAIVLQSGPGITINVTGNNILIESGDSYVDETGYNVYVTEDGSGNYIIE